MMDIENRVLNVLEYNKILEYCSSFAVLECAKEMILNTKPLSDYEECAFLLKKTDEAYRLLYEYSVSGIEYFDPITDQLDRAKRGAPLSAGEILRVLRLLRSSRIAYNSILSVKDDEITALTLIAQSIYHDNYLEEEISFKILAEDKINDNASAKLADIRRKIKRLNEQIKDKLNYYVRSQSKYLQDTIITMRGDRYVVPVKSEFRGHIKGLIHDQSSTGSTLFVEPVEVLEMNNDLKTAYLEEQCEIEAILADLSQKIGLIATKLQNNIECLAELDYNFAKAIYAYKTKAIKPNLNANGYINIVKGRHPLIEQTKVIPVDVSLGSGYNYLLVTGPNTGGKTVTMKLVGLFTLMGLSGFYIQAEVGSAISVFDKVFCDIGDEQSIEQSLSTFSSHMRNVINVTEYVDNKSLVLLDEIGAGTDPDEGSAIARAVLELLIERGSYGIVTTHYSALKEYAFTEKKIMNASMDFDEQTFAPKYRLNIGLAGSSNAIKIATKLGLSSQLTAKARGYLSENKVSFENVLEEAEKTRQHAEKLLIEYEQLNAEKKSEIEVLLAEKEKFNKEREKFFLNAKIESRRIVNERLEEAEEMVAEIKAILDKDELDSGDLIKARTLKNKLENEKYNIDKEDEVNFSDVPIDKEKVKTGDHVYVNSMEANGVVVSVNRKKQVCDVSVGLARVIVGFDDLFVARREKKREKILVHVERQAVTGLASEINVIGKNVSEAIPEVETFLDKALFNGLKEVKIIHGVGLKILSSAIHQMLKKHPRVESFRFGKYGEGEHGVTFVILK